MMYRLKCNAIVQGKDEVCDVGVQVDAVDMRRCTHRRMKMKNSQKKRRMKMKGFGSPTLTPAAADMRKSMDGPNCLGLAQLQPHLSNC
jgi:hypothetical protein